MKKFISFIFIICTLGQIILISTAHASDTSEKKEALHWKHKNLFVQEDFVKLDASMNGLQRDYETGKWTDEDLYELFSLPFFGSDPEFEELHNKWVSSHPKSYAAYQLRGMYWSKVKSKHYTEAKLKYHFKTLKDIPVEQSQKIKKFSAMAIKDYRRAIQLSSGKPILSYMGLIDVHASLSDMGTSEKKLLEANKRIPDNLVARRSFMKWLGSSKAYNTKAIHDKMRQLVTSLPNDQQKLVYKEILGSYQLYLLKQEKYKELDHSIGLIQKSYEVGEVNDKTLLYYFENLSHARPEYAKNFTKWVKAFPKSYAARQVRAMYFANASWLARGTAYSSDMSQDEHEGMAHYWKRAFKDCQKAITLTGKPILSYRLKIQLLMTSGGREDIPGAEKRASLVDPLNTEVRQAYMFSLQTRWGGSLEEMQTYLESIKALSLPSDLTKRFERMIRTEKSWLAGQHKQNFKNIEQLVTGL